MVLPVRYPSLVIDTSRVPIEERGEASVCAGLALFSSRYAYSISAAVALVDYCDALGSAKRALGAPNEGPFYEWRQIAARDAAINVYHVRKSVEHIRSIRAPVLKSTIDYEQIDLAFQVARSAFPDAKVIRDSVAHTLDFIKNHDRFKHHAVDGKRLSMGVLRDRQFTVSYEGDDYSFIMDATLRDAAFKVSNALCNAFMNVGLIHEPLS